MLPLRKSTYFVLFAIGTFLILATFFYTVLAGQMRFDLVEGYVSTAQTLFVLAMALVLLVAIVEFVSLFIASTASWTTFWVALFLLGMLFFSKQGAERFHAWGVHFDLLRFPGMIWNWAGYGCFLGAAFFAFCFLRINYGYNPPLPLFVVMRVALVADFALFIGLSFFGAQWVAVALFAVILAFLGITVSNYILQSGKWDVVSLLTMFIVTLMIASAIADAVWVCFPSWLYAGAVVPMLFILIVISFFLIYLAFVLDTGKESIKRAQTERQLEEMQTRILKNQISSHFLFNSLNVVKAAYRDGKAQGDHAVDLLSKYFRSFTEAGDVYLVPINNELELMSSFMQLHALKIGHEVPLIFNIDEDGYEVPYFSLQPLLENALNYSGVDTMEGGYIQIDSSREGDHYRLAVKDNGCGFDPSQVSEESVGIKNVTRRFRLLLSAEVEVVSSPGQGTTILITIPIVKEANA